MSYRSHTAAPSRVFDHLYDPLFTTSDQKNVYKEDCIALMRSAPIQVYPVFNSMFSELTNEERNCYAYQKNTLPNFPNISSNKNYWKRSVVVTGADRTKFFTNPLSNIQTINIGLMAEENFESGSESEERYRTMAIQTVFRESSAQTKPFLPECYMEQIVDEIPEVVHIADMIDSITYPGLKEIEIIERSRKRRQWEMSLPPINAPEEIASRVTALEAFEWEEWVAREKDINECQQARLKIVSDLIAKREQKHKNSTNQKIENCKKRALVERNRQKNMLIHKYQRNMRKLDLAQRKGSMHDKKDPVLDHFDRKIDYSLPKIRVDTISKKRTQIDYTSDFALRFMSLEEDSNAMLGDLQRYLRPNKRGLLWKPKEQTREVERGIWNENYLKKLHATLKKFRLKKCTKRNLPKCLFYEETPTESPQTMPGLDDHDEKIYQNVLQTQKTIKGRAIQSMIQKGVKKFRDAIEEAKETHSIAAVRKLFPKEFSQQIDNQHQIMKEYKRIEELLKNDDKLQEELKKIESKDAGNLLNFLEKELMRLQGEKRAHALFLLTERERYGREAAALTENDEIERQFHNDAITLYLENILIEGINRASDDTSREYIRKVTRKIDKKASRNVTFDEKIENFSNDSNTESINADETEIPDPKVVVELLKDQIFPKLFDRVKNEQLKLKQKKFLHNAHQELFREEFLQLQREQEYNICSDIIGEIIENAVTPDIDFVSATIIKKRQDSAEAEMLALHLIEQILNEIVNSNFETSTSTSETNSTSRDYDGDDSNSNIQSITETETESSADVLARQVVQNVLSDILEHGIEVSSTSDFTETSDS